MENKSKVIICNSSLAYFTTVRRGSALLFKMPETSDSMRWWRPSAICLQDVRHGSYEEVGLVRELDFADSQEQPRHGSEHVIDQQATEPAVKI